MSGRRVAPRVALVTGGNRGIGAAVARRLAAAAAVHVAGRDVEACRAVAESLRASGAEAWPLALDVTEAASVREAVAAATAASGPIDWLVNNAGIAVSAPLLADAPEGDQYRRHMEVNFHGARGMVEALLPGMRERGYGRVVNVASSAGLRGYAYVAAYCASKHALVGYTRAAARELAGSGVAFHVVCPHYVESPMLEAAVARLVEKTGRTEEDARAFFQAQNPGGRLVQPEEVAAACFDLFTSDGQGLEVELDGTPYRGLAEASA